MRQGTITNAEAREWEAQGMWEPFFNRRGTNQVEVPFALTGNRSFVANKKLHFDPDDRITGKTIKAIELVGAAARAKVDPSVDNAASNSALGYMVLCNEEGDELITIPLWALNREQNGNKLQFVDIQVKWDNCYLRFTSGILSAANGFVFNLYTQ